MRARCERTAVERCRAALVGTADFGSVMPILSIRVRWGRAIGWVCKPEGAGSSPARSIAQKWLICRKICLSGVEVDNSGASAVRADLTISCRAVSTEVESIESHRSNLSSGVR